MRILPSPIGYVPTCRGDDRKVLATGLVTGSNSGEAKFVARDWSDVDKCCPWPFTQPRIYPDSLRATVIAMGRESWGD